MAIIVQKFGGTSVANAEKIRRAARRVMDRRRAGYQVVVVASARGQQTDELVRDALELNPNPPQREMDQLLSTGEQQTVSLFAMALEAMGCQAISFTGGQIRMMTDGVYSKAQIKSIDAEFIRRELTQDRVVIVAGFQGIDEYGNITTLGRGGSDTSAVALAAALKAEECEIFTDVDGVYTADPRIFRQAVMLDEISYDEMLEMASLGAGVMHIRSVAFGKRYNVQIRVRNSGNDNPGTIITHEVPQMEGVLVSGATIQKDMAKIGLAGVPNVPGTAAKVFRRLAEAKVVVNDPFWAELVPEVDREMGVYHQIDVPNTKLGDILFHFPEAVRCTFLDGFEARWAIVKRGCRPCDHTHSSHRIHFFFLKSIMQNKLGDSDNPLKK